MKSKVQGPKSKVRTCFGRAVPGLCLVLGIVLSPAGRGQALTDEVLARIRFDQKLDARISPALVFRDENGAKVRLGDYFGRKPVVLVLGYYGCPMLCTLVLNGMVESAADMKWSIGREFEVVNVSINPRETPALAAAKKRTYVRRYGRSGSAEGWHFLTGDEKAIQQLADEVGFGYAYDPTSKEYAHPSGLIILTPEGKVSRYLFGVAYAPRDLAAALQAAAANRLGSPIQQFILLCFHYNPTTGKYSGIIMTVVRLLGAATVLGLAWLMISLVRHARSGEALPAASGGNARPVIPREDAGARQEAV